MKTPSSSSCPITATCWASEGFGACGCRSSGACACLFVFHCPQRFAPARIATPVSLVDLLPTLVELGTGARAEKLVNPVDGASLVGHLNAQDNMEERDILVEYCSEGFSAPWFMVRRGRYKFVFRENTPPLLFDLETDPEERVDLAPDPAHAATVDELRGALLSEWDVAGLPALMTESRQRRATIFEANNCGKAPVWDYAVDNDPYRLLPAQLPRSLAEDGGARIAPLAGGQHLPMKKSRGWEYRLKMTLSVTGE